MEKRKYREFYTHDDQVIKNQRLLKAAYKTVAAELEASANRMRSENLYAPHVVDDEKDKILTRRIEESALIRSGELEADGSQMWLWQLVNKEFTGKCVALYPSKENTNE
jgi:hypothetical protein